MGYLNGNFRPFPWPINFNPPCIFPPVSNKFLSSPQDRASAQQQLWMVEDTLAGLGGPQKPPHHTDPDSPSPALQGEESLEREVRLTFFSPPASCSSCPGPTHYLLTSFSLPWAANQPQARILSSGSLCFLIRYTMIIVQWCAGPNFQHLPRSNCLHLFSTPHSVMSCW